MLHRKPDLIVPIRDRRQHKRYLTVKNFGKATIALALLFAAITIRSEMRGRTPGEFGKLFQREIPEIEQKPVEVVREAPPETPIPETPIAETVTPPAPFVIEDVDTPIASTVAPETLRSSASEMVIVGGPEGVTVVRKERRRPVLAGGFGRR